MKGIRQGVSWLAVAMCVGLASCQFNSAYADERTQDQASPAAQKNALVIENDSQLPDTYPGAVYEVHFVAHGGVPPLRWRVENGALPPGIKLEENGVLHGAPERGGEFQFTASVTDSGKPQQAVQKQFLIRVRSAMTLVWKTPAHVNGNRMEGSAEVSNTTPDNIDLTFIVLAVASNGRATAIGYQHFVLARGLTKELLFGDTLPNGPYVVHVDAVGEVATKKMIYRERLQTGTLQVTVGP